MPDQPNNQYHDPDLPEATSEPGTPPPYMNQDRFEEQTLADLMGLFLRAPAQTWDMLFEVAKSPRSRPFTGGQSLLQPRPEPAPPPPTTEPQKEATQAAPLNVEDPPPEPLDSTARQNEAIVLGFRITTMLVAWSGNSMIAAAGLNNNPTRVGQGVAFLVAAVVAWLIIEVYVHWEGLRAWVGSRQAAAHPKSEPTPPTSYTDSYDLMFGVIHPVRLVLFGFGVAAVIATVIFTRDNQFTLVGFMTWVLSTIAFGAALASDHFLFNPQAIRLKIPPFWKSSTFYILVTLMVLGLFFRTINLERTPPQMTSDHVEKLLDAQRVLDGNPQVFFPNNGGREPFQMYAMAALSSLPGLHMDFTTLKLLSALEGVITLPFLWWFGRAVIGREDKRLGNIVGLTMAGLVAVSGWHVALSRLALRIVLTPLIAAWLYIYLGRAMRYNQRDDFLKAGLVLGAGLYMYQAVRMLPVVVVVGILLAVLMRARTWAALRDYAANFFSLVFMSFVTFVPLLSFSLQFPDLYWRRTAGRLLGDSLIQEVAEDGTITMRDASFAEQLAAFRANLPILGDNIRDALLMFNYKGDVAWINNYPNAPVMDMLVGGLFVLGLAAWGVRIVKRRDAVDLLMPAALFLMLLPSALSIAYPIENPSATRTSGALPVAYLFAAYPLALMVQSAWRLAPRQRIAGTIGVVGVGLVMSISFVQNAQTYFNKYHNNYLRSSLPYEQAGDDLRAFNFEVGTRGNAFMIAYPYWWDHRALGLAGGMVDYPNGIIDRNEVPNVLYNSFLRGGRYELKPEEDLLFFFAVDDIETLTQLQAWFPAGRADFTTIEEQNRSYGMYRVPALGMDAFTDFLRETEADINQAE